MSQITPVPGPSQADFDALNGNMAKYINISSSGGNISTQSDAISWVSQHGQEYSVNRIYPVVINYSGWGYCYGYAFKAGAGFFIFEVGYEAGARKIRFIINNGSCVSNKYIEYTGTW